ncbi:virulence factor MviN [[Clostridium] sordellii]|nr:virulence factor MviN [[Clostridium] sordellii] [Paeniclostridium sordellii]
MILVIHISIGAIVLANPIISLLFQRGEFDERATNMTATALICYSIGMIGFGLRDILGKVFYSLQDTKTPIVNEAMSMIINIILNLVLLKFMGHAGLAIATSISALVCILLLFRSLNRKIGYFGQDKILKVFIKSLISSIAMGVVTYFSYTFIKGLLWLGYIYDIISLFIAIYIRFSIYLVIITFLKIEEVSALTSVLKKFLNCKIFYK